MLHIRLGTGFAMPPPCARRTAGPISEERRVSTPPSELFTTDRPLVLVARNVSSRWLAIFVDTIIGLAMLPFNVSHLGTAAYGLWILTASITAHFSILNL